jgi:hypothetical protein
VLEERSEIYTGSSGEGNRAPAKEVNVAIDMLIQYPWGSTYFA